MLCLMFRSLFASLGESVVFKLTLSMVEFETHIIGVIVSSV